MITIDEKTIQEMQNFVRALDSVFVDACKGEPEAIVKATVCIMHLSQSLNRVPMPSIENGGDRAGTAFQRQGGMISASKIQAAAPEATED